MNINLIKAKVDDAELIHGMQVTSFLPLLQKYQDYDTNPANEAVEKVIERINQSFTDYYIIIENEVPVGGIRIVKLKDRRYRISPVFVLPEYQGRGIAQEIFKEIENLYRDAAVWELTTIKQESGNCYLYEKIGYRQTGWTQIVNDSMTLVAYEKH